MICKDAVEYGKISAVIERREAGQRHRNIANARRSDDLCFKGGAFLKEGLKGGRGGDMKPLKHCH